MIIHVNERPGTSCLYREGTVIAECCAGLPHRRSREGQGVQGKGKTLVTGSPLNYRYSLASARALRAQAGT